MRKVIQTAVMSLLTISFIGITAPSYADGTGTTVTPPDSTRVQPHPGAALKYQSYVNTNDCTNAIYSGGFGVVAGSGGGHMNPTCPSDHPVMYNWQMNMGYVANTGGGTASIKCCAVAYRWAA
jgi:hypothetical protein